ncbi:MULTISPECIES: phosphatidylserine decarboxylase [Rickettsieae]|jgi:phosphatidylserine decarboxylase|uniref:phosphatidylserine decarboxylase n=1 Tax=Rickettsieae TaxID=33988 RepID=UPI000B9AE0C7|nr:phosphatidylserine decarboxylase [Rickettsia endosymbiont of Culicoides newsteadi]OZG31962.1 phosphatidylserine decarboxylase proenzyme [Rickettsia endosymbiont of Culicoides newsteadi]HJD56521.1 phosphatidylserine decarboxylase [Rickettsia endosymbiont of Sericostoma sp. HW-2014]HJD64506.1 phosphatidylserine decarboxylase [Rickettsia endosymbiont of Sericostoma sp.]
MKQYNDLSKIIHREGYIFIVSFAVITFLLFTVNNTCGYIGLVMTIWCVYFFRNPDRFTPISDDLVVSPADGIVQKITEAVPPIELGLGDQEMIRVSIFLNIFNIHVNRIPANGKILSLHYNPGKFFNASLDKASIYNERQSVLMETKSGHKIAFVQIAGLIARRILCDLEEDTEVRIGDRYGIIRFGSRADVYLPLKTALCVTEGQTAVGGETIIADFKNKKTSELKFERR